MKDPGRSLIKFPGSFTLHTTSSESISAHTETRWPSDTKIKKKLQALLFYIHTDYWRCLIVVAGSVAWVPNSSWLDVTKSATGSLATLSYEESRFWPMFASSSLSLSKAGGVAHIVSWHGHAPGSDSAGRLVLGLLLGSGSRTGAELSLRIKTF